MPCPRFDPQISVRTANSSAGRIPLIDEYDGLCHAGAEPVTAPESARFRLCNHGNSQGVCPSFPVDEKRSCLRYEVTGRVGGCLRVLCIEEKGYTPVRWYAVEYNCGDASLRPEPEDHCVRSQVIAFCRSYLAHFGGIETNPDENPRYRSDSC